MAARDNSPEPQPDTQDLIEEVEGLPEDLSGAPVGEVPAPPVDSAAQELPFGELDWVPFEQLCSRLAGIDGSPELTRRYGTPGQAQSGIDVYSRLNDGTYATYQCKRWVEVTAAVLVTAVDKFLDGDWATKSRLFHFCTSASLVRTELADEIEAQATRLRDKKIGFEVWDAESLALRLKAHPGLVEDFFGEPWVKRFSRPEVAREMRQQDELNVRAEAGIGEGMLVVSYDWAASDLKEGLDQLRREDPQTFVAMNEAIGSPPKPDRFVALLDQQPPWLKDGDATVWELVARIAEKTGAWASAQNSWEVAAKQSEERRVVLLCSAAAAAGIADDTDSEKRLRRARSTRATRDCGWPSSTKTPPARNASRQSPTSTATTKS